MLVGVGVTLVAALLPARRATKVAPVAALREAGDAVSRVRLPGRVLRAVTGLVGRPSARVGGSAGRLARTNAMRHPGRTAATASALLIGVALVTAVTVVAKGLQDVSAGSLERRVQATAVVASADGWTPIDPAIERAVASAPGVTAVSSLAQDGALAFGDEEGVNGVDPATVNEVFAYDLKAGDEAAIAGLGRDGALVDDGWATEHGLKVGDTFTHHLAEGHGARPDRARDRGVAGARRPEPRPDHDLARGLRRRLRHRAQPLHAGERRRRGRRWSRRWPASPRSRSRPSRSSSRRRPSGSARSWPSSGSCSPWP